MFERIQIEKNKKRFTPLSDLGAYRKCVLVDRHEGPIPSGEGIVTVCSTDAFPHIPEDCEVNIVVAPGLDPLSHQNLQKGLEIHPDAIVIVNWMADLEYVVDRRTQPTELVGVAKNPLTKQDEMFVFAPQLSQFRIASIILPGHNDEAQLLNAAAIQNSLSIPIMVGFDPVSWMIDLAQRFLNWTEIELFGVVSDVTQPLFISDRK